jgi:hypothetical protein
MFCEGCGRELGAEARFCGACGRAVGGAVVTSGAAVQVTATNPYRGKNMQIWGNVLTWPGLLLLLLAAGKGWGFAMMVGLTMFVIGVVVGSIGKFEHWYHAE